MRGGVGNSFVHARLALRLRAMDHRTAVSRAFDRADLRERKRRAVVRAAASAFNAAGFANTSMEDVAARLGITKPTLYQYFRSKQEILFECHLLAVQHGEAGLRAAASCGGSGLEKVLAYAERFMTGFFDDLGACTVLLDVASLREEDRGEIIKRREAVSAGVEACLQSGVADGSVAACDPKLAAFFIFGVVNWMSVWYRPDGQSSPREILDLYSRMLRSGLQAK